MLGLTRPVDRPAGLRSTKFMATLAALCLLALAAFPAQAQAPAATSGIAGSWTGMLADGQNQLHLVLTIKKSDSGEYSGRVNSVDQGAVLPLDAVTLQGEKVRFEVKSVGGVYEGTLNDKGDEITGTWVQASAPAQALSFKRSAAAPPPAATAPPGPKEKPIVVPVDVTVPIAPTAFEAGGKLNLAYELHIVNMGKWESTLAKVDVISADSPAKPLASFSGAVLEGMIDHPGLPGSEPLTLAPGTEAVVFVWVGLDGSRDVPAAIRHNIHVKIGTYPEELSVETNSLPVATGPVIISAPLEGGHWLAGNGPSNTSPHRRALIPVDGRAVISQRYAIDWVRLGDDGKTYHGDPLDNKNYYAYGVNALAVADGIVTEVKDGIPQNIPGENSRAVPITLETVGGNHVILNIGNGRYAFYAHLQPGSIRVKAGDKVHRGQVLGLVGNSGNSTEPHLHFHISNASSPLGSEGLPYSLTSFEVEGEGWTWKPSDAKAAPVKHTMEIPLENEVVQFSPAR